MAMWPTARLQLGSWRDENVFYRPEINPHHFSHAGAVITLRLAEMFVIPTSVWMELLEELSQHWPAGFPWGGGDHKDTTF